MSELLKRIFDFLTNRKLHVSKKIIISILSILAIILLDNYYGFSYYFLSNLKVEHVRKIEEAKRYALNDSVLTIYLNQIEAKSIARDTYIDNFFELFKSEPKNEITESSILEIKTKSEYESKNTPASAEKWFPEKPIRSKLWHTITSSFAPILGVFISFIALIISFFNKSGERFMMLLGSILLFVLFAFLIWVLQWLLGLIPVILNRAYLNYILSISLNIVFIIGLYKLGKKQKQ